MSSSRLVFRSMHNVNAAVANKLRPLAIPSFFCPPSLFTRTRRSSRQKAAESRRRELSISTEQLRSQFASALVQAGTCRHASKLHSKTDSQGTRCQSTVAPQKTREKKSSKPQVTGLAQGPSYRTVRISPYTREDYIKLIDFYQSEAPRHDTGYEGHGSDLGVGNVETGLQPRLKDRDYGVRDAATQQNVQAIEELVSNGSSTPEAVFDCYHRLPSPGVRYLTNGTRQLLIRKLSVLRHRNTRRTFQYFSVLDDMKRAGIDITAAAWNSALHLGGKTSFRWGEAEVEAALRTWKDMEVATGIKSHTITFNILFDIAAKAGKDGLAKMIHEEMIARGLPVDRFTRFGRIFAQGLRGDGAGVRQAYREYVDAGEIVDTATLNCVMSALINSGEPEAAENVYHRMKELAIEREGKTYNPRSWSKERELAQLFNWVVQSGNFQHIARERLQAATSLAPNLRTCNTLLWHFCKLGELERAVDMLDEMQRLNIKPDNRTFVHMIQAFFKHGGVRYSAWTASRLKAVWHSYVELIDVEDSGLYLTKWLVLHTLRAFRKCCGAQEEQLVWEELKSRWKDERPFEEIAPQPRDGVSSWDLFES